MKITLIALICFLAATVVLRAQQTENSESSQFVDVAGTIGKSQGTGALSYVYNWRIGRKRKITWCKNHCLRKLYVHIMNFR